MHITWREPVEISQTVICKYSLYSWLYLKDTFILLITFHNWCARIMHRIYALMCRPVFKYWLVLSYSRLLKPSWITSVNRWQNPLGRGHKVYSMEYFGWLMQLFVQLTNLRGSGLQYRRMIIYLHEWLICQRWIKYSIPFLTVGSVLVTSIDWESVQKGKTFIWVM